MRSATLVRASLRHYGRTHAAVVLAVATAVAVLAGSLLVGESVRASLARLAVARLGRVSDAMSSSRPFREGLADDVAMKGGVSRGLLAPIVALRGSASLPDGSRRAGDVVVYGVDERFFALQGSPAPAALEGRAAMLSPALAAELQVAEGDSVLLLVEPATDISGSTLFGRRDDPGVRVRVVVRGTLSREGQGEFSLQPSSAEVRAAFVPLGTIQRALGLEGRVNTLLASSAPGASLSAGLAAAVTLDDLGLRLRVLPDRGALALESVGSLLDDAVVATAGRVAAEASLEARPALIYVANAIRGGGREVPYSLVAAVDDATWRRLTDADANPAPDAPAPVVLNRWAADALATRPGEDVALDYFLWDEGGRMLTRTATFRLAGVTAVEEHVDRDLVPSYPGITETTNLSDWDPPFPIDLSRVAPRDEEYWDRYRTTPKAIVPLRVGQSLWGHRLGRVTSLRLLAPPGTDLEQARARYEAALRTALLSGEPAERLRGFDLAVTPARENALKGARGATDFGEYFVSFSFFLMASALLLAGLFFRLGVEQRIVEVGLLRALGFTPRRVLGLLVAEGGAVAVVGAGLGVVGALAYARLMMLGLSTVWSGAVGTRELSLAVSPRALLLGALGGLAAALFAITWTLRDLSRRTPRAALAGAIDEWTPRASRPRGVVPLVLALIAGALLAGGAAGVVPDTGAFFGAGASLLLAAVLEVSRRLRSRPRAALAVRSVLALGRRAASVRPGRSVVSVALVASAAFVIVSVGAFRHGGVSDLRNPASESGGFTLLALAARPIHHDPRLAEGRAALGLSDDVLEGVTLARFRRSAGEDASCLNLYRPVRPTLLGAEPSFLRAGRFAFLDSLATGGEAAANPWLLLEGDPGDGAVPVVADGTTLRYVLGRRLGEEMPLGDTGVRVRFVGALRPGLLQSELVTSEHHFQRAFPDEAGYRFFLLDVPLERAAALTGALETGLGDFGLDVTDAASRLRAFHRVENTYIATFQTLGALGLLLGTVGLGAVLMRNALERRRELALMQAVGYRARDLRNLVLGENALLLGLGLLAGIVPALVAIAPALREHGGGIPVAALAVLTLAVLAVGGIVSWVAVGVIRRLPLLASLRSE